jgi:hypothetical protein
MKTADGKKGHKPSHVRGVENGCPARFGNVSGFPPSSVACGVGVYPPLFFGKVIENKALKILKSDKSKKAWDLRARFRASALWIESFGILKTGRPKIKSSEVKKE